MTSVPIPSNLSGNKQCAATAFDDPETGETYIIIFNESLYLGDALDNTLMNPNQVRANGLVVDDVPKHLSHDPNNATYSIYEPQEDLRIPLQLKGVISYFPSRYPSEREMETCKWIEFTSSEERNPDSSSFSSDEEQCERALETIDVSLPLREIYGLQIRPISIHQDIDDHIISSVKINAATTKRRQHSDELRNKVARTLG